MQFRSAIFLFYYFFTLGYILDSHAQTQSTSNAPVRIFVGAPAGGSTDTMARVIAQAMGHQLGRHVIVENRPGAGGNLAAELVARASPDGQTLLMSFTSHTINASLYPQLPFDPIRDFTPLTMVSTSPSMLVAHPSVPASNMKELIALAKAISSFILLAGTDGCATSMEGEVDTIVRGVKSLIGSNGNCG